MPFAAQYVSTPTGFGGQTLSDWISALQRLQEGRVSNPSEDKMYAVDPRYERTLQPEVRGEVEALPFGDEGLPQLSGAVPLNAKTVYDALAYDLGKAKANDVLAKAGFDGITHTGGGVTGGPPHRVFIAFDPKTLHSAMEVEGFVPYKAPPAIGYGILSAILGAILKLKGEE